MAFGKVLLSGAVVAFLAAVLPAAWAVQAPPAPPTAPPTAPPPALPPGPGLVLINERCGFCHATTQATGVRKTRANWEAVMQSMVDRGAELTPEEQAVVTDYLATNNAPVETAGAAPAGTSTP
ncbi:hypothetical protein ABIC16_001104 [Sphingomonas sp. PvP055]|uniref:hypothetical protein n=1 Tax=Sphingomonas sp. PvP055 TaxID=3156391 RepID=UPI00339910AE